MAVNDTQHKSVYVYGFFFLRHCGPFVLTRVTDNEESDPGLGTTLHYDGTSTGTANVYVYPERLLQIPEGPLHPVVMAEFNQSTRDVLALQGKFGNDEIILVERYYTGTPDLGHQFLCAEFVIKSGARTRRSMLFLTAAHGHFVKLRITLGSADPRDATGRLFADEIAIALWGRHS